MFEVETSSLHIYLLFTLRFCVQLLFCPSFEGSVSFFIRRIIIMEIFCENCLFAMKICSFFLSFAMNVSRQIRSNRFIKDQERGTCFSSISPSLLSKSDL